jgi:hypothetical protein
MSAGPTSMAFDYASICRFVSSMNFNLSGRVQTLLNISGWNQEILGSKISNPPAFERQPRQDFIN